MRQLDETAPLHPLHTPEYVADHVLNTRRLPGLRATGRTTALALSYIVKAMQNPFEPVAMLDHFDTTEAHANMKDVVNNLLSRLDFRGFVITRGPASRAGVWSLSFGSRT